MFKKRIKKFASDYSNKKLSEKFYKKIVNSKGFELLPSITTRQKADIKLYFNKFKLRNINTSWHKFYASSNNDFQSNYIPEDLYYIKIEPALNNKNLGHAFMDKNYLDNLFQNTVQPKIILKNINNFFIKDGLHISFEEAIDLVCNLDSFVIKPTIDSGGGKNVVLVDLKETDDKKKCISSLFKSYKKNFVLQEKLVQNAILKKLNISSINTIRCMTYLNYEGVHCLSSLIRIGRTNQFTDNSSSGGISVGIQKDGTLKHIGFDSHGKTFSKTDNGCEFLKFNVPMFEEIKQKADELHRTVPHFRLISWDFSINDKNEIVLLEFNLIWQEINFHQLNNGPLFGDYTHEILSELRS